MRSGWHRSSAVLFLMFSLIGGMAAARGARTESPRILKLRMQRVELLFDAEVEDKRTERNQTSENSSEQRVEWEPGLRLGAVSSLYHPYLLELNMGGVLSRRWEEVEFKDSGSDEKRDLSKKAYFSSYDLRASVLKTKPYALHARASRTEFERKVDFFSRDDVQGERVELRGGYKTRPKELQFTYQDWSQEVEGARASLRKEKVLRMNAAYRVDRERDAVLEVVHRDITRTQDEFLLEDGILKEMRFRSRYRFDGDRRRVLRSDLYLTDQDTGARDLRRLQWEQDLVMELSDTLRSTLTYRLEDSDSRGSGYKRGYVGSSLSHQLYESLASSVSLSANTLDAEDGTDRERYQGIFNESYTKHLGDLGLLKLGASYTVVADQRTMDSQTTFVRDERLRLNETTPNLLSYAGAIPSSVIVRDQSGTLRHVEGRDYEVISRGQFVEIRRLLGSEIPEGGLVLVDYEVEEARRDELVLGSGRYRFRINLFDDLFSTYGWMEKAKVLKGDSAGESVYAQQQDRKVLGVESRFDHLQVGAEYEGNDTPSFPYTSYRLYQSFNLNMPWGSSGGLNCSQQWRDLDETNEREERFSFTAQWQAQPTRALGVRLSAGWLDERRAVQERDRAIARADIKYRYGLLDLTLGYEYNGDMLNDVKREDHRLWLRTRRRF